MVYQLAFNLEHCSLAQQLSNLSRAQLSESSLVPNFALVAVGHFDILQVEMPFVQLRIFKLHIFRDGFVPIEIFNA